MIKPEEVKKKQEKLVPDFLIEIIDTLIICNYDDSTKCSKVNRNEILQAMDDSEFTVNYKVIDFAINCYKKAWDVKTVSEDCSTLYEFRVPVEN